VVPAFVLTSSSSMVKYACSSNANLKREEKRDDTHGWIYTNFTSNQWALDWDNSGSKCDSSCEDVFDSFMDNKDCKYFKLP
jgi:hypothetical protein